MKNVKDLFEIDAGLFINVTEREMKQCPVPDEEPIIKINFEITDF